jgi:hypothetical protein
MSLGRVSECIYKTPPDKSAAISGGLTERQSQTARLRHRERRSSRLKQIFFEVPAGVLQQRNVIESELLTLVFKLDFKR